jgi:ferredoxin-NADP reductase
VSEPVSAAKRVLLALKPGDEVKATTVGGDFLLPRDTAGPLLLIAAGIGITPFMSYLRSGELQRRNTVLLVLARTTEDVPYADELDRTGVRTIIRTADSSSADSSSADSSGANSSSAGSSRANSSSAGLSSADRDQSGTAAGGRLDAAELVALVPDIDGREVYISGAPASVASLRTAARQAGARHVHTDAFAGY